MKIRRLPETDLALIATLPLEKQRAKLEGMRLGRPPFSYDPVRTFSHDIFNVQPVMFDASAPTRWEIVKGLISAKSRSDKEMVANLAVAKALHDYAINGNILGRGTDFLPLAMSTGHKVTYWSPLVLIIAGKPIVPFIDPRRALRLTPEARRFTFSMMHQRIRVADPDYADVAFGILQFSSDKAGNRTPYLYTDDGVELLSFEALENMVAATYAIWQDVCENRDEDTRRRGTGTHGPLL